MSEVKDNSWLDRIKDLLGDSPKDKKDLITLLTTAANDNLISQDSYQMILGVFNVSEIPVREIMIPRPHVIAIDVNEELNTVITKVIESAHSRVPVINERLDEIIGILHAKDLLKNQINTNNDFDLHDYMRPATFIPESKRLNILLNDFKASRNHIAIVIDEHSNVSGLVTLEDLIEEIIGEIDDEHDVSSREFIIQQAQNKYIIDALLALDDFIFTVLSADSKKINRIQLIIKKDHNSA